MPNSLCPRCLNFSWIFCTFRSKIRNPSRSLWTPVQQSLGHKRWTDTSFECQILDVLSKDVGSAVGSQTLVQLNLCCDIDPMFGRVMMCDGSLSHIHQACFTSNCAQHPDSFHGCSIVCPLNKGLPQRPVEHMNQRWSQHLAS